MDDIDALNQLEKSCFSDPWSKKVLADIVADPKYLVLLEPLENGSANSLRAGYFIGSQVLDEAEVGRIGVYPHLRGQGVGGKLLDCALHKWHEAEVSRVFLEVRSSNLAAIHLYKSRGFDVISTRRHYYDDGEDAFVMSRSEEG